MEPIRPTGLEPTAAELEALLESETLESTAQLEVADEVKVELLEDVEGRHEADQEDARADEPRPSRNLHLGT